MSSQAIVLQNDDAKVVIIPRAGGRIISFESHGREWLWRNPELISDRWEFLEDPALAQKATDLGTWKNWGGDKSWPAPQGWSTDTEWAGPPDPILDSGAYTATVIQEGRVCLLKSAPDSRTGLQIERRISMPDRGANLSVMTSMTNTSKDRKTWACWTVTQVNTEVSPGEPQPWVEVGNLDDIEPVVLFEALGKPRAEALGKQGWKIPVEKVVGKLGFPGANGSLEVKFEDGLCFGQQFKVERGKIYPDQGSRAEIWMQFPTETPIESLSGLSLTGTLVEIEALGPLTTLEPGESTSLLVEWSVCRR
jgi:hypothetical protein